MMDILQQAAALWRQHWGRICIAASQIYTILIYFALDSEGEDLGGFGQQCVELVHENQFDLSAGLAAQKHRKNVENHGF